MSYDLGKKIPDPLHPRIQVLLCQKQKAYIAI